MDTVVFRCGERMQVHVVKHGSEWVVVWSVGNHQLYWEYDNEHAARAHANELRQFAQKKSHTNVTGSFKDTITR